MDNFNPIPDSRLVYREVPFILQPNSTLPVAIQFQMLKVIACSDDNAIVGALGYSTDTIRIAVGLGYGVTAREVDEGKFYNALTLRNTSASIVTLSIAFAFGNITDDRITIGGSITTRNAAVAVGTVSQPSVGNTATSVAAANSNRKSLLLSAGTTDAWYGDNAGVTTANGFLIPAGQSLTIENTEQAFLIRNSGANNAYVLEEAYV